MAGSSGEQRENLGVTTPDYYFYLNQSGSYTVEDVNDKKEFSDTMVTTPLVSFQAPPAGRLHPNVSLLFCILSKLSDSDGGALMGGPLMGGH